jgi:hypothetical protein
MNEDQGKTPEANAAPAEKQLANIVRGQIPVLLVHMIRFGEKGNKEADVAKKYGTTGGKVADIVKGRNFAYVTEGFKPTQEQKDAAVAWLKKVPDYDKVGTDAAVVAVEKMGTASAEDAAAFLASRTATRKTSPKTAPAAGEGAKAESKPNAPKANNKGESKPASKETVNSLLS